MDVNCIRHGVAGALVVSAMSAWDIRAASAQTEDARATGVPVASVSSDAAPATAPESGSTSASASSASGAEGSASASSPPASAGSSQDTSPSSSGIASKGVSGSASFTARPASPDSARATSPRPNVTDQALARIIDRPHTVAELEAGIIALPNAPISPAQRGGDTPFGSFGRGDATPHTGLHVLYRWNRSFAVGAGALFSPFPTSNAQYNEASQLPRTHSRSYFFLGGEGRYIPLHYRFLEGWVGVSVGGVVIADRFTTDAGDRVPPILGTREVTVRTEGFAFGVQMGGSYYLSENWIAGLNGRAYRWILPSTQRCSSIGDCATLSGSVDALEFGLTIGYRLPL